MRQAIGWTRGEGVAKEFAIAVGSYAMTLPILAVGLLITLVLISAMGVFGGNLQSAFPGGVGPAHPIIAELAQRDLGLFLQILLVGSIAAPIVEETFFRGVLFQHLVHGTRFLGFGASVTFATLLNAFVFAIIHPQGVAAVPALASLAAGFSLTRAWRGSVLPSIVMHGLSNGLVLTMVFLVAAD